MIQMTYPLYQDELHQSIYNQDNQVWFSEPEKETFDNNTRTEAKEVNILNVCRFLRDWSKSVYPFNRVSHNSKPLRTPIQTSLFQVNKAVVPCPYKTILLSFHDFINLTQYFIFTFSLNIPITCSSCCSYF